MASFARLHPVRMQECLCKFIFSLSCHEVQHAPERADSMLGSSSGRDGQGSHNAADVGHPLTDEGEVAFPAEHEQPCV